MDVVALTRALVDIESITDNEEAVGEYLFQRLRAMAGGTGGAVEKIEVEPHRFNVLACWGTPIVTLSTHMDTVPPFFASREDDTDVWGRGACDTKGIIASMIQAAERLLAAGVRNFGLLFVVGEERNSAGAYAAAQDPRGSKFIINGEPTENRLALGSKGCLRYELIARGRMAHSAYPELGDSAIHKLVPVLQSILAVPLPVDLLLGPSTLNIGTITGGRATNVIADYAKAEVMIRIIDGGDSTDTIVRGVVDDTVEISEVLRIPAVRLGSLDGFETTVVAYTTDIPAFGTAWGQPFLIGPGTIHVAHTTEERVPKAHLHQAVDLYEAMVRRLMVA
ncbi:MAG: M20/M25/M40 family metallo-hydrolase [Bryobacteraceae bacterium]|nr:M20/M25/M40 family metallo-hydrolase [Bryobacteraceae bacterium]